ncbi:MAG: hypothetical protein RL459_1849 [Pseudomonadota bacterium]
MHSLPLKQALVSGEDAQDHAATTKPLFASHSLCVGAMVPKRWAKRAVTRNAIKRQIYNACSSIEADMPVAAYVIRLRAGFDRKHFASATSEALKLAVRTELQKLLARLSPRKPAVVPAMNPTVAP